MKARREAICEARKEGAFWVRRFLPKSRRPLRGFPPLSITDTPSDKAIEQEAYPYPKVSITDTPTDIPFRVRSPLGNFAFLTQNRHKIFIYQGFETLYDIYISQEG